MLVLSRKVNDTIIIGENIRITLTMIRGQHVRIAIEAPADIPIVRGELLPNPESITTPSRRLRRSALVMPIITEGSTPRKP
jgi:carbon storage regulator CsrA